MNRSFSIYLEIIRIFATLIVFIAHAFPFYQPFAEFNQATKLHLGRDGVVIFFVLSGFVITWCANERDKSFVDFAINRASRIYSVAIPAIVLGFAVAIFLSTSAGQEIPYQLHKLWIYLPIYLSFTGDFWHLNEAPPANFPYWSLNFEVWYYVIFAAFFYIRSSWRWLMVFGLLVIIGPAIVQMFPLWLAGSLLYYRRNMLKLSVGFARFLVIVTSIGYLVTKAYGIDDIIDQYNGWVWSVLFGSTNGGPPQLLGDYFLGLLVFINFIGALNANLDFSQQAERWVKYLASYSFSFYLFHIPILSIFHLYISGNESFIVYMFVMASTCMTIMFLGKYTEHKKGIYRKFFRNAVMRVSDKTHTPNKQSDMEIKEGS